MLDSNSNVHLDHGDILVVEGEAPERVHNYIFTSLTHNLSSQPRRSDWQHKSLLIVQSISFTASWALVRYRINNDRIAGNNLTERKVLDI